MSNFQVTVTCADGDGTPCRQLVKPEDECVVSVAYTYRLENKGPKELDITSLSRTRFGQTESLIDRIANANPLAAGGSISTVENESINLCFDGVYETRVVAEADSPACEAIDTVVFGIVGATTPVPTSAPTALALSSSPTVILSVSSSPTVTLTASPSETPVNATTAPDSDCDLFIEISCVAPFFGADCNEIETVKTECLDLPSSLVLRYTGGDCSSSFNIQPNTLFSCSDGQEATANASFIVASGLDDEEAVYFSGIVGLGDDFAFEVESLLAENTNILIYDPVGSTDPAEIIETGILLQNVTFHTSCDNFLFLKDRFGAVQLIEFQNERQGRVTSYQDITLSFTVELPEDGSIGPTVLTDLFITSNIELSEGEIRDLSSMVIGVNLTAEAPVVVQETFLIDLTQRSRYTSTATIVGQSDVGKICQGSDRYQFTAGNPLPPIFPTMTPTASPTVTPVPTPDPETSACVVEASISCSVADGRRCDLRNPQGRTCIGTAPSMLQFMYQSSEICSTNTSAANFNCTDVNVDIARPDSVYVRMRGEDQDEWFSAIMVEGQIADIPIGRSDVMTIQISTVENEVPRTLLQFMEMDVLCNEESALTLLTYFGSLQLVGYQNAELGVEQVFANIEIEYKSENAGVLSMELSDAVATSPFTGFQDFLDGEKSQDLARGESSTFSERFTLNLEATAGSDFFFTFLAQGRGAISKVECDSTDEFTLIVEA